MKSSQGVLLVEHVDATGAAPGDVRARAAACRDAGLATEIVVLDSMHGDDLLYPTRERRLGPGIEIVHDDAHGRAALRARIRTSRAARVLWAGTALNGGAAASECCGDKPALWWPTGHAGAPRRAGSLAPVLEDLAPCDGAVYDLDRTPRARLSLWDGPFVLVPAPMAHITAQVVFDAFARATRDRDELDLVVLDHPDAGLEALARAAEVGERVHFIGCAPREAEVAWLQTAQAALVPGDAPLSGGLLLRALGAGCALLPVGAGARAIGDYLARHLVGTQAIERAEDLAFAIERSLERSPESQRLLKNGRALAAAHDVRALAGRIAQALAAPRASDRKVA